MINYFDNSSTTKPCQAAIDAFCLAAEQFGNPSSLHRIGLEAEHLLKSARKDIAALLSAEEKSIFFTSGGTEANNMAILGTAYRRKSIGRHLITTAIEHPSVLNAFHYLEAEGWQVTYLPVDRCGKISLAELESALTPKTTLVSIAHVNNEVGTLQPIREIGKLIRTVAPKCYFHVDCVQSFLKIPIDLKGACVSLASFSAHKVHGFKGCGALYVAPGVNIDAVIHGGGQERGLRSGTENIPGITAFAAAAKWNAEQLKKGGKQQLAQMGKLLQDAFSQDDSYTILCPEAFCAPHIISIARKGVRGEVLLHALEQENFYVSTGSACSSHKRSMSHVLQAMGCNDETAQGVIRISLSHTNTPEQTAELIDAVNRISTELQRYS